MNNYNVTMCRTGYSHRVITVEATSEHHAEEVALDIAGEFEFSEASSEYTVEGISVIPHRHPTISHWDSQPGHPIGDWRYEVANDDTRLGYLEWIAHRREADRHDKA